MAKFDIVDVFFNEHYPGELTNDGLDNLSGLASFIDAHGNYLLNNALGPGGLPYLGDAYTREEWSMTIMLGMEKLEDETVVSLTDHSLERAVFLARTHSSLQSFKGTLLTIGAFEILFVPA